MINKTDGIINFYTTSADWIRLNSVQYDHTA